MGETVYSPTTRPWNRLVQVYMIPVASHDEPVAMADDLRSSLGEALNAPQDEEEHSEVVKENIISYLKETFRQCNVRIRDHFPNIQPFIVAAKPLLRGKVPKEPEFQRLRKVVTKVNKELNEESDFIPQNNQ